MQVAAGKCDAFRRYAGHRARLDARAILRASERRRGYDSDYAGESAFLNIADPSQLFQVFFLNTGTTTWQKNTASQVNLAICHADKTTSNVVSPNADWNDGTWLSSIAYATTSQ